MAKAEVAKLEAVVTPPTTENMASLTFLERLMANPDVSLERVDHAWTIHQRIQADLARKAYDAAFADMQPELPIIEKKGKSHNGKYGKWEDIVEQITPVLAKHGFGMSFRTTPVADKPNWLRVTAILSHRAGHREENSHELPPDKSGNKHDIHAAASTTSYGKRYTGTTILNVVCKDEDDDAQIATGNEPLSDEQMKTIRRLLKETNSPEEKFLTDITKTESLDEVRAATFATLTAMLETKKKIMQKAKTEAPL